MLLDNIEQDLKAALLAGDKDKATLLRGLKSAVLYEAVAKNKRDEGLSDDEVLQVLAKESKKRQEAADLYTQGGGSDQAAKELSEKAIIDGYLPAQLSEEELLAMVKAEVAKLDNPDVKAMGQVIGAVKAQAGSTADGAVIAKLVKQELGV